MARNEITAGVILLLAATWEGPALGAAPTADAAPSPLWVRACVQNPSGADACFVQQFVIAMPENAALLKVVFSYLGPEGKPRLEITAPLGIALQPGLALTIDGAKPITLPLNACQTGGCLAVADLDTKALDRFRNGKVMTVRYVAAEHKATDLPVKLEGLTAALKSIAP